MMKFLKSPFSKGEKSEKKVKSRGLIKRISGRISNMFLFIKTSKESVISFIKESRARISNLEKSNYDVGVFHLENGHIWDAECRFKFLNKFWPNYKDGKYYLAYCFVLNGKNEKAKPLLEEFSKDNPKHNEAKRLLEAVNKNKADDIIKKYEKELEKNLKKSTKTKSKKK